MLEEFVPISSGNGVGEGKVVGVGVRTAAFGAVVGEGVVVGEVSEGMGVMGTAVTPTRVTSIGSLSGAQAINQINKTRHKRLVSCFMAFLSVVVPRKQRPFL